MPESQPRPRPPERVSIDTLLPYLRTRSEANVKELIARNLGTGVYHNDPEEVLYWAIMQIAFSGKPIRQTLVAEAFDHLNRLDRQTR
jgi:hypothetical protein